MNENTQIRERAWKLLWSKGWIWKLLGAFILLKIVTQGVIGLLDVALSKMGICNILSVKTKVWQTKTFGVDMLAGESLSEVIFTACFVIFIRCVMESISFYGKANALNMAADDNPEGCLKAASEGFRLPLELAWLGFRVSLVYFCYLLPALAIIVAACAFLPDKEPLVPVLCAAALLAAIFAVIPFYKYRYLFRIKADNPDWSAGKCMSRCYALSCGEKWRMFKHDCSYWGGGLVLLALGTVFAVLCMVLLHLGKTAAGTAESFFTALLSLAVLASYLLASAIGVVVFFYNGIGHSLLYRKILSEKAFAAEE